MWRFLKINEPDIDFFNFYRITADPPKLVWNRYNIIHPEYQANDGLRQDAVPDIFDRVRDIARSQASHQFLLVLDQGEPQPCWQGLLPQNLAVFKRRFTAGAYNFYGHPAPESTPPCAQKWLFCPMGRADLIRTRWFDLMCERDLLANNNVSYLCTNFPERVPDAAEYHSTGGQGNGHRVPFNNFESESMSNDQRHRANWNAMHQCLFGISVETGSTEAEAWYNERTYNILAAGLVPVVIAGSGAMGQLENLGFRVPDYINWRLWDQWPVDQWGQGVDKMARTIQALQELTERHTIRDIAQDWRPHSEHNQRHWLRLAEQHDSEDRAVAEWVLTVTHNLSNRRYQDLIR